MLPLPVLACRFMFDPEAEEEEFEELSAGLEGEDPPLPPPFLIVFVRAPTMEEAKGRVKLFVKLFTVCAAVGVELAVGVAEGLQTNISGE